MTIKNLKSFLYLYVEDLERQEQEMLNWNEDIPPPSHWDWDTLPKLQGKILAAKSILHLIENY